MRNKLSNIFYSTTGKDLIKEKLSPIAFGVVFVFFLESEVTENDTEMVGIYYAMYKVCLMLTILCSTVIYEVGLTLSMEGNIICPNSTLSYTGITYAVL